MRRSRSTRKEFQMKKSYRRITRRLMVMLAVASLAALLLVASPAGAATGASSAQQGYTTSARIEQTVDPKTTTGNKLPFTGLDVLAIVAVGGALLAVGVGVRKISSTNTAS
jgi:hypothetical protein